MDLSSSKNTYIITHALASEQVRLIQQEQLLTRVLGGLLSELAERELEDVEWVLDLACGPGEWAQELAFCHRDMEVWGIDISRQMIASARMHARTQNLDNAHFEIGDLRQPLRFDDNSFDLVNGRFLVGELDRASWPPLLKECVRILKPGGILRLTEIEGGPSSSAALQQLNGALARALAREERTFSVDGHTLGMAHMLGKLLRQAGCEQVQQRPFLLDASHESAFHFSACQNAEIFFSLVRPYFTQDECAECGRVREPLSKHAHRAARPGLSVGQFRLNGVGTRQKGRVHVTFPLDFATILIERPDKQRMSWSTALTANWWSWRVRATGAPSASLSNAINRWSGASPWA